MYCRSTVANLLDHVLEAGQQVDVIYTDLIKAFDRVCHEFLIQNAREFMDPYYRV